MNKKGFTVVELLVSFTLSMVVMIFLFQTVISLKDLYIQNGLKTELISKRGIINRLINDDFISSGISKVEKCDGVNNCYNIELNSGEAKELSVNKSKRIITYGNYVIDFPEGTTIGDITIRNKADVIDSITPYFGDIINVAIPITSSNFKKINENVQTDYGIRAVYQKYPVLSLQAYTEEGYYVSKDWTGKNVTLEVSGGENYTWYKNGELIDGVYGNEYDATCEEGRVCQDIYMIESGFSDVQILVRIDKMGPTLSFLNSNNVISGVVAVDNSELITDVIVTNKATGDRLQADTYLEEGDYVLVYTAKDKFNNVTEVEKNISVSWELFESYSTPKGYTLNIPTTAYYKLEVWGAQGGRGMLNGAATNIGGYGGYATGVVHLNANDNLFIHVGGVGGASKDQQAGSAGGYNGGGTGGTDSNYTSSGDNEPGAGGGGATHIATVDGILSTLETYKGTLYTDGTTYDSSVILIVAGGGGGSYSSTDGASGGGFEGNEGKAGTNVAAIKGTQTSGGGFGQGTTGSAHTSGSGGGGGGFYSGGGGGSANSLAGGSGGGGSGYIGSHLLTDKYMYCYSCLPDEREHIKTYSTENTCSDPITDCAKSGSGAAKISQYTVSYN